MELIGFQITLWSDVYISSNLDNCCSSSPRLDRKRIMATNLSEESTMCNREKKGAQHGQSLPFITIHEKRNVWNKFA